ncbi:FecR domain-containing protein [Butyrivibrio sp. AE2032]|uniref:FecR domain-containing protein n=1 Tax=Butyrivibrio sp. AE2032 TaxID=1458463 RepID=UPI00054EEB04|nr:FecR domain-containing protein [Butyrivibrio sp. AE2032]
MRKRLLAVVMVALLVIAQTGCGDQDLTASTMRMLKQEGIVKLYDSNNKELSIKENLRLNSGNSLTTEAQSLAGVALDDTKTVTIDELSNILVNQDGKKLSIDLKDGSLFFEVTEKLDADASFDIRTSTMVVGIRGTSGIVTTNDKGEDVVIVTDGSTEVTAIDLGTGKTVTTVCNAGHSVTAHVVNEGNGDEVTFDDAQVKPSDLKPFATNIIANNERLMEVVPAATGWSQDEIREASEGGGSESGESGAASTEEQTAAAATSETTTEETTNAATGASSEEGAGAEAGAEAAQAASEASSEGQATGATSTGAAATAATASTAAATTNANAATARAIPASVAGQIVSTDASGVMTLVSGEQFDPAYYLSRYPELAGLVGTDPYKLLEHYLNHGKGENRTATPEATDAMLAKNASGSGAGTGAGAGTVTGTGNGTTKTPEQQAQDEAWEKFQQDLARAQAEADEQAAEDRRREEEALAAQAGDSGSSSESDEPYDPHRDEPWSDENYDETEPQDPNGYDNGTTDPDSGTDTGQDAGGSDQGDPSGGGKDDQNTGGDTGGQTGGETGGNTSGGGSDSGQGDGTGG